MFDLAAGTNGSLGGPASAPVIRPAMLFRHKRTIALVAGLLCVIAVPCILFLVSPTYQAEAAVYVSPVVSRMVFRTEDNGVVPLYQQHLNTQAHILRSPAVLDHVLDQERIRQTHWYREEGRPWFGDAPSAIDRLKNALTVVPSNVSEVISVSMRAQIPREAKLVVDTVVEEYEKLSRAAMGESDSEVYKQLDHDYTKLQREIVALDQARYNLSKQVGTLTPEELRSQRSTHLSVLESKRAEVERQLALSRYELETRGDDNAPVKEGETGAQAAPAQPSDHRFAGDLDWRQLKATLNARQHELEFTKLQFGPAHPDYADLKSKVDLAERLLRDREAQLGQPAAGSESGLPPPHSQAALALEVKRLEYELSLVSKDVEDQRERVTSAGDVAQRLAQYDEELRRKREFRDQLWSRLQVLETESKAPLHIRVAQAAEPSLPDRHRRALFVALAVIASLGAGLGVAYLRVSLDPVIHGTGDVPVSPRSPFLGQLPLLSKCVELTGETNPSLMEHVRMVRTALLERVKDIDKSVVLITSCSMRTGKTSVAVLLARSLAQLGKKVLLVEADLYRPCLAERLGLPDGPGLIGVLCGSVNDSGAIMNGGAPRFDVLPAGVRTADFDAELLANSQFAGCLHRWKGNYDFVILDGPPVLPVADARILARHADGTIMVLRSSQSRKQDLVQAYADLGAAGGTLMGTVMVGGEMECGSYDRYPHGRELQTVGESHNGRAH